MSDDKEWIDHDDLTESETDLLKQLADSLENPPDCLADYSKYWSIKGETNGNDNSDATQGTTETSRTGREPSHHGQRSRPQVTTREPRDRSG